jgi:hypothetical protein
MRAIQNNCFAIAAVLEVQAEASRQSDKQLPKRFMRVSGAGGTAWHVVDVVCTGNVEGQVPPRFDHCQISTRIYDFRQVDSTPSVDMH